MTATTRNYLLVMLLLATLTLKVTVVLEQDIRVHYYPSIQLVRKD